MRTKRPEKPIPVVGERTFVLTDHICRECQGGRVLKRTGSYVTGGGNPIFTCADCEATTSGMGPDGICWCGMKMRNQHDSPAYRCLPFSAVEKNPHLLRELQKCGCDPAASKARVGIVTVDGYRNAADKLRADEPA